jgi:hypothetical protein
MNFIQSKYPIFIGIKNQIMKPFRTMLWFLFPALLAVACTWNNEEDLYGDILCDTVNITWSGTVLPILQNNCLECHNETLNYNGIKYTSYANTLVPVSDGRFRGVTNRLPGYVQMPYLRPKLNSCTLGKLNTWLDDGAPEN